MAKDSDFRAFSLGRDHSRFHKPRVTPPAPQNVKVATTEASASKLLVLKLQSDLAEAVKLLGETRDKYADSLPPCREGHPIRKFFTRVDDFLAKHEARQ